MPRNGSVSLIHKKVYEVKCMMKFKLKKVTIAKCVLSVSLKMYFLKHKNTRALIHLVKTSIIGIFSGFFTIFMLYLSIFHCYIVCIAVLLYITNNKF